MVQLFFKPLAGLRAAYIKLRLSTYASLGQRVFVSHRFAWRLPKGQLCGRFVVQGAGRISIGRYCSFRADNYIGAVDSVLIGDHV